MTNDPRLTDSRDGNSNSAAMIFDEVFPAPIAAGTAMHATVAAGAPLNVTTGFTDPLPSRTTRIVLGVGGANPVVYTVEGLGMDGRTTTDTITAAGAGTYDGVKAFRSVTKLTSNVDPLGTTDLQTGPGLGIPSTYPFNVLSTLDVLSVNGVVEAGTKSVQNGTVIPTTAPNGARNFVVRGTRSHYHSIGE